MIRDNDAEFSGAFDEVFEAEGIEVIRTTVEAPQANAIAERFVGTVPKECFDWILIADRRHLERILRTFADHHNGIGRTRLWASWHRTGHRSRRCHRRSRPLP